MKRSDGRRAPASPLPDSRMASAAAVAWVLLALAGPAIGAAPQPPAGERAAYAGRPLADVLRELQADGLPIVFTSELVRPGMRVAREPEASDPRQALAELLAAHGLGIDAGPGGVLVVVARSGVPAAGPALTGAVLARGRGAGLPGAAGAFTIAEIPAGVYTLEARAPGYLGQSLPAVVVTGAAPREVVFRLNPQPFLEEEILVRPSRLSLLLERPDSPFSFGREEIESLPHLGDDVFRTTSLLPGTASNDVSAQLSVHGGRRDEVRIVLDGQELYDAYHLKDYDSALSIVPAHNLAGASLTTGAFPVAQGDRMSGVLDLRTREPTDARRFTLGASVFDALAASSGRLSGDRGGWLITGRRGALDLASNAIGKERPSFWDVFGKLDVATAWGPVTLHGLTAGDRLEVKTVEEDAFEALENNYRSTYAWLTHQGASGERLLIETLASWSRVRRNRGGVGDDEEGGFALRDVRNLEVLDVTQTWSLQLGPRQLTSWGFEARRYDADFDYGKELDPSFVVIPPFPPPRAESVRFDDRLRGEHLGLWASDRLTLGNMTGELGLRFDRHTATDDTLLSPRLNLAWRLGERSVVRAAWGRFFQSQRPYELQVEDGERRLLPAELTEHWVLGFETLPASNRLGVDGVRVELFRREVDDPRPRYENLIEPLNFLQEIEPDRVRIAPDSSRAQGVETLVRGRWGARLDWWLAYSWSRVEDRIAGVTFPRSLDQPHTAAADLNWRLPRDWSLNVAWRFHSGWPTTPVGTAMVPDPDDPEQEEVAAAFGRLNSERFPSYHRLDLRASCRWPLRRGELTFFVDVQNLYDRQNLAGFDLTIDEEEERINLDPETWPGIFPSLGFVWEF